MERVAHAELRLGIGPRYRRVDRLRTAGLRSGAVKHAHGTLDRSGVQFEADVTLDLLAVDERIRGVEAQRAVPTHHIELPARPRDGPAMLQQEGVAGGWRATRTTFAPEVERQAHIAAVDDAVEQSTIAWRPVRGTHDPQVSLRVDEAVRSALRMRDINDGRVRGICWVNRDLDDALDILVGPDVTERDTAGVRLDRRDADRLDGHLSPFLAGLRARGIYA